MTTPTPPDADAFRDYGASARTGVRELYRENHARQTLAFVRAKKAESLPPRRLRMGVWEAFSRLDALVDDSDPDTELTQLDHALQTAEAIRGDGHPRWLVATGLLHDLGKLLCSFGEPQWAVVGDTFPVGCAFSERIVHAELFAENPDAHDPLLATRTGIYAEGCGLENVHLSWGHDEYLYQVLKGHLPEEALFVIRYHSFYALHREGAYGFLLDERDRRLLPWLRAFRPYDLYSKGEEAPERERLLPYYEGLVRELLPAELWW